MHRRPTATLVATAIGLASSMAAAEGEIVDVPPSELHTDRIPTHPNVELLTAGVTGFLVSYAPAFVIASSSDHKGDDRLYIPVAGPWLDILQRWCSEGETVNCGSTPAEIAALSFDGFVQTFSAATILLAVFSPEERTLSVARRPKEQRRGFSGTLFVPTSFAGRGYGLRVGGAF
jgi:hypothetical protein